MFVKEPYQSEGHTQGQFPRHLLGRVSRRRKMWTFGMALVGLAIGWQNQGVDFDLLHVALATIWAACIGFGMGFIFDQPRVGKKTLIGWVLTMGLVGSYFAPLVPASALPVRIAIAATGGVILGGVVGLIQLKGWAWW